MEFRRQGWPQHEKLRSLPVGRRVGVAAWDVVPVTVRFLDAEVDGHLLPLVERDGPDVEIDAVGGALLPGLHDHHVHLAATAAACDSVDLQGVTGGAQFTAKLREAEARLPAGSWLRVVNYHESIAGELDRAALDALFTDRPVRVQHRTGIEWVLNSAALRATNWLDDHPTGRLVRLDDELRRRLGSSAPDLGPIVDELRSHGITGVTDTTPVREVPAPPSGIHVLQCTAPGVGGTSAPVKLLFDDTHVPDLDALVAAVDTAHRDARNVAVHAVTRAGVALAISLFDAAGAVRGDRIEHASVVPPDLRAAIARLGLTVVTQPAFIARRGDDYLRDVEPEDRPWLWPCESLLRVGIDVLAGSDAPYGPVDPWLAIAAATTRTSPSGRTVGSDAPLDAARALALFRPLAVGGWCLLDRPLADALRAPSAEHVRATCVGDDLRLHRGASLR